MVIDRPIHIPTVFVKYLLIKVNFKSVVCSVPLFKPVILCLQHNSCRRRKQVLLYPKTEFHLAFSPGGGTAVVYNGKTAPGWKFRYFHFLLFSFLFSSLLLLTSHPAQFPEHFGLAYSAALGSPSHVNESIRGDGSFNFDSFDSFEKFAEVQLWHF